MKAVSNDILSSYAASKETAPLLTCAGAHVLEQKGCYDSTHSTCLPADLSKPELASLLLVNSLALYLGITQQQVPLGGMLMAKWDLCH